MNKNIYILLLILIVEIYSEAPENCQTEATEPDEGKCSVCDDGYTGYPAGSGPYTACKTTREHCQTYDATNDECTECESNIYKLDGNPKACVCNTGKIRVPESGNPFKCYTPVANCDEYDANLDKCSKCADGTNFGALPTGHSQLADGGNTPSICYTDASVTNCEELNPNTNACYKCKTNFVFDANHSCKGGISNCLEYNADYSQCTKCVSTHKLSSSGSSCTPVSNCVNVDQTNGKCVKCDNGYKLKDDDTGTCEQCLNNGVALDSDGVTCSTIRKDDNCVKFGSNGLCEQCKDGYLIQTSGNGETASTTCIQEASCSDTKTKVGLNCLTEQSVTPNTPIENCVYYSGTAAAPVCENCDDYMYFDGSACKPCYYPQVSLNGKYCYTPSKRNGCNIFDFTEDKCTTCDDKYTLQSDGTCEYQTCTTTICTNDNKEAKTSTENASNMKLNVLFVVLLLSIFW